MSRPVVFISYSHDSDEHRKRVRGLMASLERDGCTCRLDVYKDTGEDWPAWMSRQLLEADFVLCIITETYERRWRGQELPDVGKGVGWEAGLIRRLLYGKKLHNDHVFPVLFTAADRQFIPLELQGYGDFLLEEPANYELLLRKIHSQRKYLPPPSGDAPELPSETTAPLFARPGPDGTPSKIGSASSPTPPDSIRIGPPVLSGVPEKLIGREEWFERLDRAWADPATHVFTLVAWGGVGKTSLVAKWAQQLKNEPERYGLRRYYEHSFYSQGTRDSSNPDQPVQTASTDSFFAGALRWFGIEKPEEIPPSERTQKLADFVRAERTLLILDGLEPHQEPGGDEPGRIRDDQLAEFLELLADGRHSSLCVITTREKIPDLARWRDRNAPEHELHDLPPEAGAELLARLGVKGEEEERQAASEEVEGHALTLTLLGTYLAKFHEGDPRQRSEVDFAKAAEKTRRGRAWRMMGAYGDWLTRHDCARELALLRLLGLFDRPATPDCLNALLTGEALPGLTDGLTELTREDWIEAIDHLTNLRLVEPLDWEPPVYYGYDEETAQGVINTWNPLPTPQRYSPLSVGGMKLPAQALEAHPLIREYFAQQLREKFGDATRGAHSRLFEHLGRCVPFWPEGEIGLAPLYQAVVHGCRAGRFEEARAEVFRDRIRRGTQGTHASYSNMKLGAYGMDLAALTGLFEHPWREPIKELTGSDRAWLVSIAGFALRAVGRLADALESFRVGAKLREATEDWRNRRISATNISKLSLTLGRVREAVEAGYQALEFAGKSIFWGDRVVAVTTFADARHQRGEDEPAHELFEQAENMEKRSTSSDSPLYSIRGFQYCDLLSAKVERAAWRQLIKTTPSAWSSSITQESTPALNGILDDLDAIQARSEQTLTRLERAQQPRLLDLALNHLIIGRISLYRALLRDTPISDPTDLTEAQTRVNRACDLLRQAGRKDHEPRGLLTRAWLRAVQGNSAEARADLDRAERIAERGSMKLYLADIALTRARLFQDRAQLARAAQLIEECEYGRRREELADAQAAAEHWPKAV